MLADLEFWDRARYEYSKICIKIVRKQRANVIDRHKKIVLSIIEQIWRENTN